MIVLPKRTHHSWQKHKGWCIIFIWAQEVKMPKNKRSLTEDCWRTKMTLTEIALMARTSFGPLRYRTKEEQVKEMAHFASHISEFDTPPLMATDWCIWRGDNFPQPHCVFLNLAILFLSNIGPSQNWEGEVQPPPKCPPYTAWWARLFELSETDTWNPTCLYKNVIKLSDNLFPLLECFGFMVVMTSLVGRNFLFEDGINHLHWNYGDRTM